MVTDREVRKFEKILDKMTNDLDNNFRILNKFFNLDNGVIGEKINKIFDLDKLINEKYESKVLMFDTLFKYYKEKEMIHLLKVRDIIFNCILYDNTAYYIKKILELVIKYNIDINDSLQKYSDEPTHECLFKDISIICPPEEIINIYQLLKKAGYNIFSVQDNYQEMDFYLKDRYHNKENEYILEFFKLYEQDRKEILSLSNEDFLKQVFQDYPDLCNKNNNTLHTFTNIYIDEEYSLKIIESLFYYGYNPNSLCLNKTIIEYCLIYSKHKEDYIYKLIEIAIKYGYDINRIDDNNDTLMHYVIENSNSNVKRISSIYKLLIDNGFNSSIKNNIDKSIYDFIKYYNKRYLDSDEVIKLYNNYSFNNVNENIKYLNNFSFIPIINNNYLIDNKINITNNKFNVFIGKTGLGKLDNLNKLYLDNKDNSIYINKDTICSKCELISDFKPNLLNIIRICAENNLTLYIENFDEIIHNYREIEKRELLMIIELYIKTYNLTICTVINDKELLNDGILNNVKNEIKLNEPNNEELEILIINTLYDYETKYNKKIKHFDLLSGLLSICCNEKNIINDNISNLKVLYDIINRLFIESSNIIEINDIVNCIEKCDYITNNCKYIIINDVKHNYKNKDIIKRLIRKIH